MATIQKPIAVRPCPNFPPAPFAHQTDGWIAPDGTLYPCESCEHDDCARALTGCGVYDLEESGWCHISYSAIVNEDDFRLSQPQRDILFDMFMQAPRSSLGKSIWSWIRPKETEEEQQIWV